MKIPRPFPLLAATLALLAGAAPAFAAASAPVTVTETEATFTLDNGVVRALVAKNSGDLISLRYKGQEMFATTMGNDGQPDLKSDPPGDPGRGRGMTDHMYGFWSHDTVAPRVVAKITIDPAANGGARGEVSVKGFADGTKLGHGPGAPRDGEFAADIEIRYTLGRGDSGVYTYCTFEHKPEYPNTTLGEARFCVKLNSFFDWMLVDEHHHMPYPKELEANGDDKYNYTTDQFEHRAFGWASSEKKVGCFFINASTEYLSGGPTKVEFLTHRDTSRPLYAPCILNYWRSSHYGGSSVDVAQGEAWTKVVGPFLIYCNEGGDPETLWQDALAEVGRQSANWPYAWVNGVDYPHREQRATVSGRLVLTDPLMPAATMSNVRVGLAYPDYHVTTNRPAAGNTPGRHHLDDRCQALRVLDARRRPGPFHHHQCQPRQVHAPRHRGRRAGRIRPRRYHGRRRPDARSRRPHLDPVRRGRQLWDIGIPNRNGSEFLKGDDYFHDGMGLVYRDLFPNDVNFVIGKSDFRKDWFFQHVSHVEDANAAPNSIMGGGGARGRATPWTITFALPAAAHGTATLRVATAGGTVSGGGVAVAVNGQPVGAIRVPGDSTISRNAVQGLWYEREVPFDASLLKAGANVVTLTVPAGALTNGIIYDYLRLELDESAPAPANVSAGPSAN